MNVPFVATLVLCSIPLVYFGVWIPVVLCSGRPDKRGDCVAVLFMLSPYVVVAGVSLLPFGPVWSAVLCGFTVLLLLSDVLFLFVFPAGLAWLLLWPLRWLACLVCVVVAGLAQALAG